MNPKQSNRIVETEEESIEHWRRSRRRKMDWGVAESGLVGGLLCC